MEKDIYTLEEVAQLFQLLETAPLKYRTFFTLAIYSGFRRGEMLGLEWKDIDWEHNVISVRRTSNYTASKGIYTDTTKTKKSQRSLKFPQSVMDLLREYKAEQDEERIKLGTKWQDYDRLFVKWDGRPMNNNTPYFWLKEFCEENNFRFCDIHSLRHFYASALINEGVDAAAVSGALGHSTITTTTSIYCHVFNQAQARAGDAIASVLDFKKHDTEIAERIKKIVDLRPYAIVKRFVLTNPIFKDTASYGHFGRQPETREVEVFYEDKDTFKRDGKIYKNVELFACFLQ